jgi:hypothetical protein
MVRRPQSPVSALERLGGTQGRATPSEGRRRAPRGLTGHREGDAHTLITVPQSIINAL